MIEILNRPNDYAFLFNPISVRVRDTSETFNRFSYRVVSASGENSEEFEAYRDTKGEAVLNISPLLEPFFRDLFVPNLEFQDPMILAQLKDDISKNYTFEIASEHSDGRTYLEKFSGVVVFGKVPRRKKGLYSSFLSYDPEYEFLSLSWKTKRIISLDEPLALYFLQLTNNPTKNEINIAIALDIEPGSTTIVSQIPTINSESGDVLSIAINLREVFSVIREEFQSFTVMMSLVSPSNQKLEYTIDPVARRSEDIYLYRSQAGGMSTIRLTGKRIERQEKSQTIAQKYLPPNHTNRESAEFINSLSHGVTWDVYTGYAESWEDFEVYNDFFLSSEIYRIVGSELFPVEIISKKLPVWSSDQTELPAAKLSMRYLI